MKVNGLSTLGLLGIVFIVLKLTNVITWNWWLVTLPLWGGLALIVSIIIIVGFIAFITKKVKEL